MRRIIIALAITAFTVLPANNPIVRLPPPLWPTSVGANHIVHCLGSGCYGQQF